MRSDEQPDVLRTRLARHQWATAPIARIHYHRDDDTLVVELVPADPVTGIQVGNQLLVDFDGTDPDARPTGLYLTGFLDHPATLDHAQARVVLGERLWQIGHDLATDGDGACEVRLGDAEAQARRVQWDGLLERLTVLGRPVRAPDREEQPDRIVGVELVPGQIHAVVTDGGSTVLDSATVELDGNEPTDVVDGVERAIVHLERRNTGMAADRCPVGIQLGGPVDSGTGRVAFYDKPRPHAADGPWVDVPLGAMVATRTGRRVLVSNDAYAFAVLESGTGARDDEVTALLLVRQGVGAKLIRGARVLDYPMEVGVFMPGSESSLGGDDPKGATIEAESGVMAIAHSVGAVTGEVYESIEAAAVAADGDPDAAEAFTRAGRGLARAIAAVQAIVNPDQWVVYAPACLLDEHRPAGANFVRGLRSAPKLLSYDALRPARPTALRPVHGTVGALAAALAVGRAAEAGRGTDSPASARDHATVRGGPSGHARS